MWQFEASDLPAPDANPCTELSCTAAGPVHQPAVSGKPCGEQRVCDGAGSCVACVPGQTRCVSGGPERCDSNNTWTTAQPCTAGAPVCSVGQCVRALQLAAGLEHTCALLSDGSVRCWGDNQHGALGAPSSAVVLKPEPIALSAVVQIAAGEGMHTCARLQSGSVACWGLNDRGQVGDASGSQVVRTPLIVAGLGPAVDLDVGAAHSCAVQQDGAVMCWGGSERGQLGDGTRTDRAVPVRVAGLPPAARVVLGVEHSCALLRDRTVRCWGSNTWGEAGLREHGTYSIGGGKLEIGTEALQPVVVTALATAMGLCAGAGRSCAWLQDGTVRTWGSESFRAGARAMQGLDGVLQVEAAGRHACALRADGTVRCWGNNESGQLGDGTRKDRSAAVAVSTLPAASSVTVGPDHACAVLLDGSAACWGSNAGGKLGDGTREDRLQPVRVVW